ncbi:MAG: hypothetical protein EBY28_13105 [Betaproteobacteria bacterium]|nr:hypothetical protein [Betaproteobacteria bacterium]
MSIRSLAWIFLAVLAGWGPMQAAAADLIRERGILVDPGGELSFEQVQRQSFSPVGKLLTQGFTRSTLWLRMVVDPAEASQQVSLRVLPATLDEVALFSDGAPSKYGPLGLRIGLEQQLDPDEVAPRLGSPRARRPPPRRPAPGRRRGLRSRSPCPSPHGRSAPRRRRCERSRP